MAQSNKLSSWSLYAFSQLYGKMKLFAPKEFVNTETGETFTSQRVGFVHPTLTTTINGEVKPLITFAKVAKTLGNIDAQYVREHQKELQILQGTDGKFYISPKENFIELEED